MVASGKDRRLKIITITADGLLRMFQKSVVAFDWLLPNDAKVVAMELGTIWDLDYNTIKLVVESLAFDPVKEGEEIPEYPSFSYRYDGVVLHGASLGGNN